MKNYILFPSYNDGLRLVSILKNAGIKYTIAPTPRQLSACCGMSIIYDKDNENEIRKIIDDNNIKILGFYTI